MLEKNLQRFLSQSEILKVRFQSCCQAHRDGIETSIYSQQMLVVRLQDLWGGFVRSLILLSASNGVGVSGRIYSGCHGHSRKNQAQGWVINEYNRSGQEPDWHVSSISLIWAKKLQVSNLPDITASLGAISSPEDEVRVYRNFIVHRYKHTAVKLKNHNAAHGHNPVNLTDLPTTLTLGGKMLFFDWVENFQTIAAVSSQ